MRTLNQPGAAIQTEGTEPILIVRIEWGQGSGFHFYNDKTAALTRGDGRVLSFSPISAAQQGNQSSNVSQVSIVIDDFDDKLKGVVDVSEMEGSPATVFHKFLNTPGSATEILSGRVAGPVIWNEGERTLSFDIVTEIESDLVGFSADSDQFDANNDIAVGKPWPLVFGKPAHVPAVLVQTLPASKVSYEIGLGSNIFNDELFNELEGRKTIEVKKAAVLKEINKTPFDEFDLGIDTINSFAVEEPEKFPIGIEIEVEVEGVIFKGKMVTDTGHLFSSDRFVITEANAPRFKNIACAGRPEDDVDFENPKVLWINRTDVDLGSNWVTIEYASLFDPKVMNSREYFCTRQEGTKCFFKEAFLTSQVPGAEQLLDDNDVGTEFVLPGAEVVLTSARMLPATGLKVDLEEFTTKYQTKLKQFNTAQEAADADKSQLGVLIKQLQLVKYVRSAFWTAKAGTPVRMWLENIHPAGVTGDIYVANFFESTAVNSVYADRETIYFSPIPKHYYEVDLSRDTNVPELGGQLVTTIEFLRPLDGYADQGWKKDVIYVTLTSTIGSNTVDQLKFILDGYTSLATDAPNFTAVAAKIVKYPSHFYFLGEPDALTFAKDIAFQARLGLTLDSEEVNIKYLSEVPTSSVLTLDEDVTRFKTMSLGFTPIDGVITRIKGTWRRSGAPDNSGWDHDTELRTITLSNNTNKFGVKEQDINFFIYNDIGLVRKSMTFWLNRLSHSWRLIDLETFTDAMGLQIFDDVLIFHSVFLLPFSSQISEVRGFSHDVHNAAVKLNIWVPVAAGETDVAPFAYLDDALDSTPVNFADRFIEVEFEINRTTTELDLEGIIRELKRQLSLAKQLGKLKGKSLDFTDQMKSDVFGDGPAKPGAAAAPAVPDKPGAPEATLPTETDKTVHVTNPSYGLQEGDHVFLTENDDGVIFADAVPTVNRQLRIIAVKGDYLECAFWEGPVLPGLIVDPPLVASVNIAKPWELRQTDFDGQSVPNHNDEFIEYADFTGDGQQRLATRTTPSVVEETQVIVPRYMPQRIVEGNTYAGGVIIGKFQPAGTGVSDEAGKPVFWEDANHAGREWAKKFV